MTDNVQRFRRRYATLEIVKSGGRQIVRKQYTDRRRAVEEIQAYGKLGKAVSHIDGCRAAQIMEASEEEGILWIEYIEGQTFSQTLYTASLWELARSWELLEKVLSRAKQREIQFDCDPDNIMVVEDAGRMKLVFIDPEAVRLELKDYAATVFFVGMLKKAVRRGPWSRTAWRILRLQRAWAAAYCCTAQVTARDIADQAATYLRCSARNNWRSDWTETVGRTLCRKFIAAPFWVVCALFVQRWGFAARN